MKKFTLRLASTIAVFVAVACVSFSCDSAVKTALLSAVEETNKQCPMQVDQITVLDSLTTSTEDKVLNYYYTVDISGMGENVSLDSLGQALKPMLEQFIKTSPQVEPFRKLQVTLGQYYRDTEGNMVCEVVMTPDMYK